MVRELASHRCGSGSIPALDAICGLSLLLVLCSAPTGFAPGTPVFPSPQKPTFPNSKFQWTNSNSVKVPLQIPVLFYSRGSAMTNNKKLIDVTASLDGRCLSFSKEEVHFK